MFDNIAEFTSQPLWISDLLVFSKHIFEFVCFLQLKFGAKETIKVYGIKADSLELYLKYVLTIEYFDK